MSKNLVAAIIFVFSLLGCTNNSPSKSEEESVILPKIESDVVNKYVEARAINVSRKNGWVDSKNGNVYWVSYSYDAELTRPFDDILISAAKIFLEQKRDGVAQTFIASMLLLPNDFPPAEAMAIFETAIGKSPADEEVLKIKTVMNRCQSCQSFARKGRDELIATYRAFKYLEKQGVDIDSKPGDYFSLEIEQDFMKSENGWIEASGSSDKP